MKHQSCGEQSLQFPVFLATCICVLTFMPQQAHIFAGQQLRMCITA